MTKHECAMCGRHLPIDKMVYSRFTKNRYCGIDFARCDAGSRRRKRAARKETR